MKKLILLTALSLAMVGGVWAAAAPNSASRFVQTLGHICGERFCGWHEHHHCHTWCDRRGHHWHCEGHD